MFLISYSLLVALQINAKDKAKMTFHKEIPHSPKCSSCQTFTLMLKLLLVYELLLLFFFFKHIFKLKAKIQERHPQTPCSSVNMRSMEIQSHTTRRGTLWKEKKHLSPSPLKRGKHVLSILVWTYYCVLFPHTIKPVNVYAYFVNKDNRQKNKYELTTYT